MKRWLTGLTAIAAGALPAALQAATPAAPATESPISIGIAHRISSTALGELRVVNVVLPASYAREANRRYPVLYVIDGGIEQDLLHVAGVVHLGAVWGRSTEAIVVGLETRDRRRELAGPTRDPALLRRYPTAGASASFRAFVRDEVKPLIGRSYRTNGHDAVLGESLAGLFVVETYLQEPTLFDAYASIDPSLWWDNEALSRSAAGSASGRQDGRPIYIASAKEQSETPEAMNRVVSAIRQRPARWCATSRPDLLHSTIYQQLTPQAVQFLLAPPEAPPAEYGFTVRCDEGSDQAPRTGT